MIIKKILIVSCLIAAIITASVFIVKNTDEEINNEESSIQTQINNVKDNEVVEKQETNEANEVVEKQETNTQDVEIVVESPTEIAVKLEDDKDEYIIVKEGEKDPNAPNVETPSNLPDYIQIDESGEYVSVITDGKNETELIPSKDKKE